MFLLHHTIKPYAMKITEINDEYPPGSPQIKASKRALKRCDVNERRIEDLYVYDIIPKNSPTPSSSSGPHKRLYYFAGGGWQMPASSEHWALLSEIACHLTHTTLTLVSYPLAPNNTASTVLPHLLRFYRRVLSDGASANETVLFGGDSAGGNIVLCITLAALAEDPKDEKPVPKTLFVMSPSTDLSRENPAMRDVEKHDPLLKLPFVTSTADKWRGEIDAKDVRVSPLFADVGGLARRGVAVHGLTGTYDILGPDAVLFREKLNEAGVEGEWLEWEKQMHCFLLAFSFHLPESVQGKDWIIDVLNRA